MDFRTILITLIISLSFSFATISKAQQPYHFILGQEELEGLSIYDIIQDYNQNYWLATNDGIIKFDGYTFNKLKCSQSSNASFFDLKMDYDSVIHFKDYTGQIYQIKNDSCHLRIQIPDSLMFRTINYCFDNNNNLVVFTHTAFKVNKKNEIEVYKRPNEHISQYVEPFILKDSSVIIHDYVSHNFITFKNNAIDTIPVITNGCLINFFYDDNTLCFFDKVKGVLTIDNGILSTKKNIDSIPNQRTLGLSKEDSYLWVSNLSGGIHIYDKNLKLLFNKTSLFKNNIISSFFKDQEGNMILGTFGDGLIVISDLKTTEINLPDPNEKITKITSTANNLIFIGTKKGRIYQIDSTNNITLFQNQNLQKIELLKYIPETNELIANGSDFYTVFNLNTGTSTKKSLGTIKDIKYIAKNEFLVAASVGLINLKTDKFSNFKTKKYLPSFKERIKIIGYNPDTKTIYAGTSQGLRIGNKKESSLFSLNDLPIFCRDIIYYKHKIYIATKKNGILIFEGNRLVNHWTNNQLEIKSINRMKEYQEKLFISTNTDIKILTFKGETINTLGESSKLNFKRIVDFEVTNNTLWVAHSKGISPIKFNNIKPLDFLPNISIKEIFVNDVLVNLNNTNIFNHSENKFEFIATTKSLQFRNKINYHYQLKGLNEKWQINSYHNNKIEYQSLPPGDYVLNIKAVLKNNESEVLSYSFSIKPPFWSTWWFYVALTSLFIAITFFVFKRQLRKQEKKVALQNELNASKLIAIQSQMNPHFIFNAINSIQDLILNGDTINSYDYVIKFSKLVRQTLSFSDKEFIGIEDEIELLTNYLDLEKLRFQDDFEYSINMNNIQNLQIPPMLVQPFVENALKHGLFHKKGLKKIDIIFKLDKTLSCTVSDNGIGIKKAQEIKTRQEVLHKSFSTGATKRRFKIMEAHYQQELKINYTDLTDKNDKNIGTKVRLNIPFTVNY